MKKKILVSLVLAGALATGANAVSLTSFGHLGTAYNFGIDKVDGEKVWYGGATGRLGFEFGFGPVSLGVGSAGGFPYAVSGPFNPRGVYFDSGKNVRWYNWISDLYLRVDTSKFSMIGGRYDVNTFFDGKDGKNLNGVDWFSGLNEGLSFKLDTRYFTWWGIYSYESMDFGAKNPNRIGSDLMGFHQYRGYGNNAHYVSTGFDINIVDKIYIDPFVTYLTGYDLLQAGGKVEMQFGDNQFQSTTTLRGMYQQEGGKNHTFLGWADQEFMVSNILFFGAGYYLVGNGDGIFHNGEKTRFYGNNFGYKNDFFSAGSSVWYGFAGVRNKFFEFDFVYSGGDYKEVSTIASINLVETREAKFSIGGGWVRENGYDQGVVFTKLSF